MGYQLRVQLPEGFFAWSHYGMKNQKKSSEYQCGIEGFFDMAKMKGDTFHDWGTMIEPLFPGKFERKKITLQFISVDIDFTVEKFMTDAGNFMKSTGNLVIDQFDGLTSNELYNGKYRIFTGPFFQRINSDGFGTVQIVMEIEEVFNADSLYVGSVGYRINDFPLYTNFGLSVSKLDGRNDFGARLKFSELEYPNTVGSNFPELDFTGVISCVDFSELNTNLAKLRNSLKNQFTFVFPSGESAQMYCPDGFSISRIASNYNSYLFAELKMKLKKIV